MAEIMCEEQDTDDISAEMLNSIVSGMDENNSDQLLIDDDQSSDEELDQAALMVKFDIPEHYLEIDDAESSAASELQVRDGFLEISKLDRHLKRLSKVELEAKRSRLRFEAHMALEIEQMTSEYPNSANNCTAVQANTARFLAIDIPVKKKRQKKTLAELPQIQDDFTGDEYTDDSSSEEDTDAGDEVNPVFTTELKEDNFKTKSKKVDQSSASADQRTRVDSCSSSSEYITAKSSASENGSADVHLIRKPRRPQEAFVRQKQEKPSIRKKGKRGKDFVSRNIKLAMDAASNVPMTSEEKERLSELLADIDEESDHGESTNRSFERAVVLANGNRSVSSRNSNTSLALSEGYKPGIAEIDRLNAIDSKLRSITSRQSGSTLSRVRQSSAASSSIDTWRETTTNSSARPLPLISQSHVNSARFSDPDSDNKALALIMEDAPYSRMSDQDMNLGEKALIEVREARELNTRLETIDEQLVELTSSHPYPVETDIPKLSTSEIRSLVSQCVAENYADRDNDGGESSVSTYDDALASASRLPETTLRSLLDQAKKELGLLTLEAPTQVDDRSSSSNQLYDNETWSFLREVEAHLEYPPAFLRALPDLPDGADSKPMIDANQPQEVNILPAARSYPARLNDIKESMEICSTAASTPMPPLEDITPRCSSSRFGEIQQNVQSSSPTLPPLSGRRRSSISNKIEPRDGRSSAESRKGSSSKPNTAKDISSLRLDGTSFTQKL